MSILLTRPAGENETLATHLAALRDDVVICPLIELSPIPVDESLKQAAMNLDHNDLIVFVSKSGVRFAMPLLDQYWPQWPAALVWLAVGAGTAHALEPYGVRAKCPDVAGSEGLLELPELGSVTGRQVVIVRGRGGRELLGNELIRRGATVNYLEVYERILLQEQQLVLAPPGSCVVLTSAEILENFCGQVGDRVVDFSAIVPSARIADIAGKAGFRRVENAGGASDQALYDAVLRLE